MLPRLPPSFPCSFTVEMEWGGCRQPLLPGSSMVMAIADFHTPPPPRHVLLSFLSESMGGGRSAGPVTPEERKGGRVPVGPVLAAMATGAAGPGWAGLRGSQVQGEGPGRSPGSLGCWCDCPLNPYSSLQSSARAGRLALRDIASRWANTHSARHGRRRAAHLAFVLRSALSPLLRAPQGRGALCVENGASRRDLGAEAPFLSVSCHWGL